MIRFSFRDNKKTFLLAEGDVLELAAGAAFLVSQLYHKSNDPEFRALFKSFTMSACGHDGFCWTEAGDCKGEGITADLSELLRQAEDLGGE